MKWSASASLGPANGLLAENYMYWYLVDILQFHGGSWLIRQSYRLDWLAGLVNYFSSLPNCEKVLASAQASQCTCA